MKKQNKKRWTTFDADQEKQQEKDAEIIESYWGEKESSRRMDNEYW